MLVDIVLVVVGVFIFFFVGGVKRLISFILGHSHHLLLHLDLLLHLHGTFGSVLLDHLHHLRLGVARVVVLGAG